MAKRKTTRRRSTTRRSYAAAPRRRSYRKKSGTTYIPSAAATIGAAIANVDAFKAVANDMSINGAKAAAQKAIQVDNLKKTAIYTAGGYVAGEVIKRYAPAIIKGPAGKIAKKIPRFF